MGAILSLPPRAWLREALLRQWVRSLDRGDRARFRHWGATGNEAHHPYAWADTLGPTRFSEAPSHERHHAHCRASRAGAALSHHAAHGADRGHRPHHAGPTYTGPGADEENAETVRGMEDAGLKVEIHPLDVACDMHMAAIKAGK
jgi:hypothetical protein